MWANRQSSKWAVIGTAVAAGMIISSAAAQAGTILYVDDDADPGGDGLSWDTAYRFLQDALAYAGGVTEIRVAQGTYLPDRNEANPDGTGDREATFQLIDGVALTGGYAGIGAPDPDERDIELYETIFSGDLLGNDEPDFENYDENSYHVITGDNTNATALIDGMTITAGHAEVFSDNHGGGMHNLDGSPTVINCTFIENLASGDQSRAGGMYNRGSEDLHSIPTVINCTFLRNRVDSVGAQTANGWGGGMWNAFSDPVVTNCMFIENQAIGNSAFGGAMVNSASSPTITDCTFRDNTTTGLGGIGGAMASGGGYGSNPLLINCIFSGNSAVPMPPFNHGNGGAVANFGESTLIGCTFIGNSSAVHGGAIFNDNDQGSPLLINCLFSGNIAGTADNGSGGAMFNTFDSDPTLTNCTIAGNMATSGIYGDGYGGGLANYAGSDPLLTNCILWGNVDGNGGGGESAQVFNIGGSTPNVPVVNYSCVEGGWSGAGGTGNISADPLFVDPDGPDDMPGTQDDDLHLQTGSPCIDAGDNTAVPEDVTTDLDGNPRFVDDPDTPDCQQAPGGCGDPPVVDMGAYEFQPALPCPWDLDGDDFVGVNDLLILLAAWGPNPGHQADFNGDGFVGINDLLALLANWGACP
ncbi:MAG: right-handed parallel beta-helix repeat-containing protein [Planctomycetota bacterium]|jgi:hypothetical protein